MCWNMSHATAMFDIYPPIKCLFCARASICLYFTMHVHPYVHTLRCTCIHMSTLYDARASICPHFMMYVNSCLYFTMHVQSICPHFTMHVNSCLYFTMHVHPYVYTLRYISTLYAPTHRTDKQST